MKRVNSYDPNARTPAIASRWVWEIDVPEARALIEVTEVRWNGEEWWIRTRNLLISAATLFQTVDQDWYWNDLSRFVEATTPVGPPKARWKLRTIPEGAHARPHIWTSEA